MQAISLLVQKIQAHPNLLTGTMACVPSTLHNTCIGPLRLFYLQFKQNKNEKLAVFTLFFLVTVNTSEAILVLTVKNT